ncbi:MAG: hypothetical protein CMM53_02430 [Rhodospirillaceae bacterium]|nr:hypothetical protein [Rhodospirillaceae bacterium]|tara:strand:- start:5477 stop:5896 length:420 start_codon:yes stop_codon:yes gene_type:complete
MKKEKTFHKIKIEEAPTRALPLGRGKVFGCVDPSVGSKNVDVHVNVIKPGASRGEIHYHKNAENVYIVMEGQLEVCIEGGRRHVLDVGEVGFIPPNLIHTATNARKDMTCKIIEIYAPAGEDFHEVENWPNGDHPPDNN